MPKILLVEDNEMNRDMLTRRLQRHGFTVCCAADGPIGVAMAEQEHPDLILMDVALGEMGEIMFKSAKTYTPPAALAGSMRDFRVPQGQNLVERVDGFYRWQDLRR